MDKAVIGQGDHGLASPDACFLALLIEGGDWTCFA
jgi:hypothetical protein